MLAEKTPVYVLLIDASKAFDRVSHIKLFNILQSHGVCPLIIRVLYNMHTNYASKMEVRTFKCISRKLMTWLLYHPLFLV